MTFEEAYDILRPRLSKEQLEAATAMPDADEISNLLDAMERGGVNCNYMQNIVIRYLVAMVNDLHKRISELENEE